MDFAMPADLAAYLDELDRFIAAEIKPLELADDNIRFFDHRREHARTDWDNQGLPRHEWEDLLKAATRKARPAWWRATPGDHGAATASPPTSSKPPRWPHPARHSWHRPRSRCRRGRSAG